MENYDLSPVHEKTPELIETTKPNHYDTLVLSGSHMKCIYTLGALDCLDFHLQSIKHFVGTSSGSILCYLLCIGYTPKEILGFIITHYETINKFTFSTNNILNNDFVKKGLFSGSGLYNFSTIQELLEKLTIDKIGKYVTIGDIENMFDKKITFTTFNMTTHETQYFNSDNHPEIPCLTAIRMSCNLPFVFSHFKYMNSFYVDGGITDNFPVEFGESVGQKVLGIYIDYVNDDNKYPTNSIEDFKTFLSIMMHKHIRLDKYRDNTSILCLKPTVEINDTNVTTILDSFTEGYKQTKTYGI